MFEGTKDFLNNGGTTNVGVTEREDDNSVDNVGAIAKGVKTFDTSVDRKNSGIEFD